MDEAATYDAYLEVLPNGETLAQILDLPGCFAYGASQEQARAGLTAALPVYYAWLQRHDDYTPVVSGPFEVRVRETATVPPGAFFTPDAEPVDPSDLDLGTALLEWAYADLSALLAGLSETDLEAPRAGGHSRAEELNGLLRAQLWLLSRLEPTPAPATLEALLGGPIERLGMIAHAAVARLRNTTQDERQRTLVHEGERWSLRKVLRRSVLLVRMAGDTLARTISRTI